MTTEDEDYVIWVQEAVFKGRSLSADQVAKLLHIFYDVKNKEVRYTKYAVNNPEEGQDNG